MEYAEISETIIKWAPWGVGTAVLGMWFWIWSRHINDKGDDNA